MANFSIEDFEDNGYNDLTNSGVNAVTDTPFAGSDYAADFDGSSYLKIDDGDQTGLDLGATFTLEAWVSPATLPVDTTYFTIIAKENPNVTAQRGLHWTIFNRGAGVIVEALISDGDNHYDYYQWDVDAILSEDTWTHLALTCETSQPSATTFELFSDGSSLGNGSALISNNVSLNNNTEAFIIGARNSNSGITDFYDGIMDGVRVWNDIRTESEIDDNKGIKLTGSEDGLVAYYPFESETYTSILPAFKRS